MRIFSVTDAKTTTREKTGQTYPDKATKSHGRSFIGAQNSCSHFLERVEETAADICEYVSGYNIFGIGTSSTYGSEFWWK
jgi:hypothetical protein